MTCSKSNWLSTDVGGPILRGDITTFHFPEESNLANHMERGHAISIRSSTYFPFIVDRLATNSSARREARRARHRQCGVQERRHAAKPEKQCDRRIEALKRLGFETVVGLDLDKTGMEDATIKFARAARDADVALVYVQRARDTTSGYQLSHAGGRRTSRRCGSTPPHARKRHRGRS
jgi:hypothetical protein